jgi:hypothetical protein
MGNVEVIYHKSVEVDLNLAPNSLAPPILSRKFPIKRYSPTYQCSLCGHEWVGRNVIVYPENYEDCMLGCSNNNFLSGLIRILLGKKRGFGELKKVEVFEQL